MIMHEDFSLYNEIKLHLKQKINCNKYLNIDNTKYVIYFLFQEDKINVILRKENDIVLTIFDLPNSDDNIEFVTKLIIKRLNQNYDKHREEA